MKLIDLIEEKKSIIFERWLVVVLATYPPDAKKFFQNQKDRFANPVGATIAEGLQGLLADLAKGEAEGGPPEFLDAIVRIRAIQDLSPSQALAFLFALKKIVREEVGADNRGASLDVQLLEFDARVDALALVAFDAYMKCREKVYEIRSSEWKNRTFRLLQKANLIGLVADDEENGPGDAEPGPDKEP